LGQGEHGQEKVISSYKFLIVVGDNMGELTTIPLYKNTRDRLKAFGFKGETYDQIVNKLIEKTEYIAFMERQYEILSKKSEFISLDEIA
jgi:hypothetical protein